MSYEIWRTEMSKKIEFHVHKFFVDNFKFSAKVLFFLNPKSLRLKVCVLKPNKFKYRKKIRFWRVIYW